MRCNMTKLQRLKSMVADDDQLKLFSQSDGRRKYYKISPAFSLNYSDVYYYSGTISEVIAWLHGRLNGKAQSKIVRL